MPTIKSGTAPYVHNTTYTAITRYRQANDERTPHIKHQNTKEHPTNSPWHISPWIFSFADGHANQLCANVRKQSCSEVAPESKKLSDTRVVYFSKKIFTEGSVGCSPVSEANTIVLGIAAEVDNESHQDKTNQSDDFDAAEPEFDFAKDANAQ